MRHGIQALQTLGALPIALGSGASAELRQPLGVAVVGGLVVSQALTLLNKLSTRKKQLIQQREDIEQVMHDIEQLEQYCHSVLQPPGLRADYA